MSIVKGSLVKIMATLPEVLTELGYSNPNAYNNYIDTEQSVTGLITGEDEQSYVIIDGLIKIPAECCELVGEACDEDHVETPHSIYDRQRENRFGDGPWEMEEDL